MGDFAKDLKRLKPAPIDSESRLVQYVVAGSSPRSFSLAEQLQFLRARSDTVTDILPPGNVHSTPLGSHYVVHTVYPEDYFHGKVLLSRFSTADLECLMNLMREKESVPERGRI